MLHTPFVMESCGVSLQVWDIEKTEFLQYLVKKFAKRHKMLWTILGRAAIMSKASRRTVYRGVVENDILYRCHFSEQLTMGTVRRKGLVTL